MRLGDFIQHDKERILDRWEAFATRVPAARHMSSRSLRDHGPQILQAIVADLASPQSPDQQLDKSMGLAPVIANAPNTAAQTHAVLRAESGFNIEQLASEYRALRASVLSGWMTACLPQPPNVDDMLRFNEAIDQALAESVGFFSAHVTRSRNLLLGMLSHDLRSPLQTIQMTAKALQALNADGEAGLAAGRLVRSGARMQKLLDDLIDFNRTEFGLGIPVSPRWCELGAICAEEIEQVRAAYPGRGIQLEVIGDCHGSWDPHRMQQLLNNLVINALHYGDHEVPIRVVVRAVEYGVHLSVTNSGPTIDDDALLHMFEPLRRGQGAAVAHSAGLGLGLYICSEIAKAHGGKIGVTAVGDQTIFTVSMPKSRPAVTR